MSGLKINGIELLECHAERNESYPYSKLFKELLGCKIWLHDLSRHNSNNVDQDACCAECLLFQV